MDKNIDDLKNDFGKSIIFNRHTDKIDAIDLYAFSKWSDAQTINKYAADKIKNFVQEKLNNNTLYMPEHMKDYLLTKRLQLLINTTIVEHAIMDSLNGKLLNKSDVVSVISPVIVGQDGCEISSINIDNHSISVKIIYNTEAKDKILVRENKIPIVVIYNCSQKEENHWEVYVRNNAGMYKSADESDNELAKKWQEMLRSATPKLSLINFTELKNGNLKISR